MKRIGCNKCYAQCPQQLGGDPGAESLIRHTATRWGSWGQNPWGGRMFGSYGYVCVRFPHIAALIIKRTNNNNRKITCHGNHNHILIGY